MPSFVVAAGTTVTARQTLVGSETGLISKDDDGILQPGVLQVGGDKQAIRFNGPTDGATVTNEGTIENTNADGRAIRFNAAVGNDVTATINNMDGGIVKSTDDAIQVEDGTVDDGVIAVSNAGGSITSTNGQALDFGNTAGKFFVDISNTAGSKLGVIASANESAIRIGATGDVFNQGTIDGGTDAANSDGVDGIDFQDGATGTVTNQDDAGGSISGDRHGINAGESSDITVINGTGPGLGGGLITGRNGSGVGSDGDATVFNYGTITGGFTAGLDVHGSTPGEPDGGAPDGTDDGDGDGVDIDGKATIENYGLIQGTGAGGTGSDGFENTSEGIAAGGGSFLNAATGTIKGLGLGILIDDSSRGNAKFQTTIVNDGIIEGTGETGIEIVSTFADTITNNGSIKGGNGIAILFGEGDNTLFIGAASVIDGLTDGEGGTGTLNYRDFGGTGVTVDLSAGTATGTGGVDDFQNVVGSVGLDDLTGDSGANVLDGGLGADTMAGGAGADLYYVNDLGDTVAEAIGDGLDQVAARATFVLGMGQEIERLTTSNSTAVRTIDLKGNEFAQTIVGNNGNNRLEDGGPGGADTLVGRGGNDFYVVYNAAATIVEGEGQGDFDRLATGVDYVLATGVQVESLRTTSRIATHGIDLTGNEIAQQLTGNNGDNRLDGKGGSDAIMTGLGSDTVVFSTALGADNVDSITDFASLVDRIELDGGIFSAIGATLDAAEFVTNGTGLAEDAADRIIYNAGTGDLLYDADGLGGAAAIRFATLVGAPSVSLSDFDIA